MSNDIEQNFKEDAAIERLWSHTVGITNRAVITDGHDPTLGIPAREWESPGTAVAARWNAHHFLLTAAHVVEGADLGHLGFFPRPTGVLMRGTPNLNELQQPLIINNSGATIHRCGWEDLA